CTRVGRGARRGSDAASRPAGGARKDYRAALRAVPYRRRPQHPSRLNNQRWSLEARRSPQRVRRQEANAQDRHKFFADYSALDDKRAFKRFLAPLRKIEWVIHSKRPFAGPEQVLRYLSRYTHRVANLQSEPAHIPTRATQQNPITQSRCQRGQAT